jgi:hypothetical protein
MAVGKSALGNAAIPDMSRYWEKDDELGSNIWVESFSTVPGLPRWGDMAVRFNYSIVYTNDDDLEFLRLSDIRLVVSSGLAQGQPEPDQGMRVVREIRDPWLAERVFGRGVLELAPDASRWTLWEPEPHVKTARAWVFPISDSPAPGTDPRLARLPPPARRRMLARALAADWVVDEGERVVVAGVADSPSVLVLSDLRYPGWQAFLTQGGASREVPIESAFGQWRAIYLPAAGSYEVTFIYRPTSMRVGAQISLIALLLWLVWLALTIVRRSRRLSDH